MAEDAPATKKDLADLGNDLRKDLADQGRDLRKDLADQGRDLRKDLADQGRDLRKDIADSEERLVTVMRGMETRLLRAFSSYEEPADFQFRRLKADVSNVDAVTGQRVDRLEARAPARLRG
jgi:hypothetical protein